MSIPNSALWNRTNLTNVLSPLTGALASHYYGQVEVVHAASSADPETGTFRRYIGEIRGHGNSRTEKFEDRHET